QMAERLMDRAEEGATLALAFLYGQPVGDAVEVFVLPAIVARHALHISTVDHCDRRTEEKELIRPVPRPPSSERGFGLADNRFECRRLANGEIGKHFAVDHNTGFAETGNEPAVVQTERTHRGIEALNPKRAESALAPLAVAISVLVRLLDCLLGNPDRVLAPAVIALGGFEHFLVLGVGGDAAFHASHEDLLFEKEKRACSIRTRFWVRAAGRQPFGSKYFLMLSPSVLNSTLVPRNWRICFLVRLIM